MKLNTNTTANELKLIEIIQTAIRGLAKGRNPHVVAVRENLQSGLDSIGETVAVKNAAGGYDSVPASEMWEAVAMNNDDGSVVTIAQCEAASQTDARRKMANFIEAVSGTETDPSKWTLQISKA